MQTLYFVEHNFGRLGRAFLELDRDSNSRAAIVEMIRSGEADPVSILEIDEAAGTCRNVTEELCDEANLCEIE